MSVLRERQRGPGSLERERAIYHPGRRDVKEETSALKALLLY